MSQTKINFSVQIVGDDRRRNDLLKPISLNDVIGFIRNQNYEESVVEELVKAVKKYPQQALRQFVKNIPGKVKKILAIRTKKSVGFSKLEEASEPEVVEAPVYEDFVVPTPTIQKPTAKPPAPTWTAPRGRSLAEDVGELSQPQLPKSAPVWSQPSMGRSLGDAIRESGGG